MGKNAQLKILWQMVCSICYALKCQIKHPFTRKKLIVLKQYKINTTEQAICFSLRTQPLNLTKSDKFY